MLPNDTITLFKEISGNATYTFVSGNSPKTILAVSMQQSKDLSDTILLCGNTVIAKNYAKDFPQNIVNYHCSDNITISKTGNDLSSVIISYVPYFTNDYSTTTQYGYNPNLGIASSSDIQIYGSFSAGEMMIAFVLVLQFFFMVLVALVSSFSAIKTKKRYIEYHNGDVPISDQL